MKKYHISFTMYKIVNGKISVKDHFSNCKATIEGNTFNEAVKTFSEKKRKEGYVLGFIVEGEMFKVKFFDLETGEQIENYKFK